MSANSGAQRLTIGVLARATGTKVETIRYYESAGLLAPPRRSGGNYRLYAPTDLARLAFIRRARDLGFSLGEVRDLLRLNDDKARPCGEVDEIARNHVADIERRIADLDKLRAELVSLIGQCRQGTIADCRILDALAPAAA